MHVVKQPSLSITSFASAFPQATEDEIQRAIVISQGDWERAVGVLQALVQSKEHSHSISIAAQQEQQRKEKEMARQRKNKSAIYANRTAGPAQAAPPPVKRNNDDSDSDEDDFKGDGFDSDASDAEDRAKDSELEIICTAEAIEYFNTADAESLVMMIGT
jgi:preprotein translocase subunit SecD